MQFSGIKCFHIAMQAPSSAISSTVPSQMTLCAHQAVTLFASLPILLSVSMTDCSRDLVYMESCICLFLSVYFTEAYVFKVYPCCSMCQNFLMINSILLYTTFVLISSFAGELFGCLHLGLLCMMLLWTSVCKYTFKSVISVLWVCAFLLFSC